MNQFEIYLYQNIQLVSLPLRTVDQTSELPGLFISGVMQHLPRRRVITPGREWCIVD